MWNILAFFGLIFGKGISYLTKEEIKLGKKYFNFFEKLFLFIIIIILLFYFNIYGFIFGLVLGYFLRIPSLFMGLGVVSSFFLKEYNLILASFVFVYFLFYSRELKWLKIIENVGFFFIFLSFTFFPSKISLYNFTIFSTSFSVSM